MKKGPIGVWFSVALVILLSGIWVGSKVGSNIALDWQRRQWDRQCKLSGPECTQLKSMLAELSAIQELQLFAVSAHDDNRLVKKYLPNEIKGLEILMHRSASQEIRPVAELYLGLAYVQAAMAEEQENNKEQATRYINTEQSLFQSLGWRDYSEATLKMVAGRELEKWYGQQQTRHNGK
jgi:hypothetical protein